MTNLLNDWPRESNRGFMQHFTNRALQAQFAFPHKNRRTSTCLFAGVQGWLQVLAEYSTIDTTELVLGALLAGNYFGGRVAELANQVDTTIHYQGLIYIKLVSVARRDRVERGHQGREPLPHLLQGERQHRGDEGEHPPIQRVLPGKLCYKIIPQYVLYPLASIL